MIDDKLKRVEKREDILIDGYSLRSLRSAMVLAGYQATAQTITGLCGTGYTTGKKRMQDGEFTRQQLMDLKRAFRLTDEEFCNVFFSEKNQPKEETPKNFQKDPE